MAKRKIVWSHRANIKIFEILDFYAKRNGNTSYSKKLFEKFKKETSLLIKQPEIGIKTDLNSVRGLIIDKYIIFYEATPTMIIVHTVWDCNQNPDDLIIK